MIAAWKAGVSIASSIGGFIIPGGWCIADANGQARPCGMAGTMAAQVRPPSHRTKPDRSRQHRPAARVAETSIVRSRLMRRSQRIPIHTSSMPPVRRLVLAGAFQILAAEVVPPITVDDIRRMNIGRERPRGAHN
jgi:hypothetical protein